MGKYTEKLDSMNLSTGKKARLYNLMYEYGPSNGMIQILPIDQGLEHGPRDFFVNPDSEDPEFQLRVTLEGNYSGIALQIGLAEKYMNKYAGKIPLVLKLNGKTEVPPDDEAFSPLVSDVEMSGLHLGQDRLGTQFVLLDDVVQIPEEKLYLPVPNRSAVVLPHLGPFWTGFLGTVPVSSQ